MNTKQTALLLNGEMQMGREYFGLTARDFTTKWDSASHVPWEVTLNDQRGPTDLHIRRSQSVSNGNNCGFPFGIRRGNINFCLASEIMEILLCFCIAKLPVPIGYTTVFWET